MKAVSIERRTVVAGVALVILALVVAGVVSFVVVRSLWATSLGSVLARRDALVAELAQGHAPAELAESFREAGVWARIRYPDGRVETVRPERTAGLYEEADASDPLVTEAVALPGGGRVEVIATRVGPRQALSQLAIAQLVAGLAAVVLAALAMWLVMRRALAPLDDAVTTARDISRGAYDRRLEPTSEHTELGRLASAFDDMVDALTESIRRREQAEERTRGFVADAAHQLHRPASALRASTQAFLLARASSAQDDEDRLVPVLHDEADRIGRLVSRLLLLARLDSEHPHPREHVDLSTLVQEQVAGLREARPDLDVTVELAEAAVATVDTEGLREAVENLLHNAQRHARATVHVTVTRTDATVTVSVADDGPGPDAATQQRMFDRFASLDEQGGSGLGLSIVRSVARAHGGDATYQDGRFHLTVAIPSDTAEAARPAVSET